MESKKINQLSTEVAPVSSDLTVIGDPLTGELKKITWLQVASLIGSGASLNLNDVTTNGNTTANSISIGGLTITGLDGVLKATSGVVGTYPYGGANGVATLDSAGKVPVSQLPSSIMEYKGTWNATTNTPTLVDGVGDNGDVYRVSVGGTINLGSGSLTFNVGDYVIYNGSTWEKSDTTDSVASVFGRTGVITAQEGDYTLDLLGDVALTGVTANDYLRYNGTTWVNQVFPSFLSSDKLVVPVRNTSGATITKGTVVYINGANGNKPTIAKALATSDATSAQTLGLVQDDIINNANGYVVVIGECIDIDTSAYVEGTQLYLSPTTAGTYTSTKQYAPNHLVYVGIVTRSHPTLGIIQVKTQNGFEMDELHNVSAQSPANNDGLFYNTTTSLWEKKSIATALGFTPISLTSLSASSPLSYNNTTGAFTIQVATTSQNGYLSSTDWTTFNNKLTSPMSALGDLIYGGASGVATRLAGNITTTKQFLSQTGNGTISAAPSWSAVTKTDVGLSNVENTALSTWAGSTNITTLGTIASGTWNATTISVAKGGTGLTALGTGLQLLRVNAGATALEYFTPTYITLTSLSATSPLSYNNTSGAFSIQVATSLQNGYLSNTDWSTFNGKENVLTFSAPLTRTTNTISIPVATTSVNGYLSSTDWTTFNNKQSAITLTTTGSSGASTFVTNTLNIPTYTLAGLGGQPLNSNLTSLSSLTFVSASFVKMTAANTFALDTNTYLTANQTITLSGNVTGSGTTAITTTIANNVVTNAMLSQVATATFKGRVTAATGNVEDLTTTQATSLLNVFTSTLKGLAPASGGGTTTFLRADGTWATPTGTGFTNPMTTLGDIIYGDTGGAATRLAGNITTTKQYLSQTGNGTASAIPSWSAIAGGDITGAALTKTDDTNVTLTLGGTPATALLRAASLTLGWTGQLSVARGGTGLSALGTANQLIRVNATATALEYFSPTYLTANQTITLSGDVTGSGTTAITALISNSAVTTTKILDNAVNFQKMQQISTASFLGRITAATGNIENITGTQATTLLDVFTSTLKGVVPASGGGTTNFLRADGTWAAPTGGGTLTGSGTANTISKWTSGTALGNSSITDNGTTISMLGTTFTTAATLTAGTPGSFYIVDDYSSPVAGRIFFGDGTGWSMHFSKRAASVTNDIITISDAGNLSINSGRLYTGNVSSTNGSILLQDNYSSGNLTTLGTSFSSGGPVIGWGVYPSSAAQYSFLSATSLASYPRGALVVEDSLKYFTGGAQTVTIGSAISVVKRFEIATTGQLLLPAYTSTTSFTGTLVGYLGFDASGNIITTSASTGTNIYNSDGTLSGVRTVTMGASNLNFNASTGIFQVTASPSGTNKVVVIRNNNTTGNTDQTLALDTALAGSSVDINLASSNPTAIRMYCSTTALTTSPSGAGFQMFTNTNPTFQGHIYFDSGAHNNAQIHFRTAATGGTITTRLFIDSAGVLTASNLGGSGTRMVVASSTGVLSTQTIPTGGSFGYTTSSITSSYTETATSGYKIVLVDTTSAAVTITLPTAVGNTALLVFKKTAGANNLILDGATTETIDGSLTATISVNNTSLSLISNNSNWLII